MEFEYDSEVDCLYVWFINPDANRSNYGNEVWPEDFNGDIGFIFDKRGHLMALDILKASKYFDQEKLDSWESKNSD